MRGAPLLELFAVLLLGTLLAFPLHHLTRPAAADTTPIAAADPESWETWVDLRFSHPPQAFRLYEDSRLLLEGAGELRVDDDVTLTHRDGHLRLRLEVEWPGDVEQGYVQLSVEPEGREARREGAWGRGNLLQTWEFTWPMP